MRVWYSLIGGPIPQVGRQANMYVAWPHPVACQGSNPQSPFFPPKWSRSSRSKSEPDPVRQHNRLSSRRRPIFPAAERVPASRGSEFPECIPRPADTRPARLFQNPPSRSRSTSSPRLRGRRAAASSILRCASLAFSVVARRSASRPVRSPARRIDSKNNRTAAAIVP